MADAWARLGLSVAGGIIAGPLGFLAGAWLGGQLFPDDYDEGKMPPVDEYPIQSSAIGTPIPIVFGSVRIAGNIIWMGDSQSYQVRHSSGGGKGGGGNETVTYETKYRRSFLISICEGPANINRAWKGKTEIDVSGFTSFTGEGNSGISTLIGEDYAEYSNLCLAYFEDYELGNSPAIPNFLFEVSSLETDTGKTIFQFNHDGIVVAAGVHGVRHWAQTFTVATTHLINSVKIKTRRLDPGNLVGNVRCAILATAAGKPIGAELVAVERDCSDILTTGPGEETEWVFPSPITVNAGTKYAFVWSDHEAIATNHLLIGRNTNGTYAGGNVEYDQSGNDVYDQLVTAWDFWFEESGSEPGEVHDMNFALMIKELLTNERYGNYEESDLITADFDSIIAYCEANDLKGSLAITSQRPLTDWIAYICSHFQGFFYEIGGKIGLNCYRDQASVLSISQDDLVRDRDTPPVHIRKREYSTTSNRLEVTWTNRDNNYKTAIVSAFDRVDQREAGQIRLKTLDLKAITNAELASKMAWRSFIDQMYRFSQYTFKLGYKSMLLTVGDVIDVTDGHLLVAQRMRVMSVDEEKDGRTSLISAVEDLSELYPATEYAVQESELTPDPPITLSDGTISFREDHIVNKLHLSVTPGGDQTNGFYIYKSYDDITYELVGKAAIEDVTSGNANSIGTIQNNLPAFPAVVHRSQDAFTVDIGTVTDLSTAISDADFFNNRKLARVGNEIIAYKTCVETSAEGVWRVSNLIRGLFGTEAVAHLPAEGFNTLDIDYPYTLLETDTGKTIYFKVVSYYAAQIQSIADVSSQSVFISGKYLKPLPVSLMRIEGREGLLTYKTVDVVLDWYFCSKVSGFGRGGYGVILWGAYLADPLLERLKVELEEQDGTDILTGEFVLDDYGEPTQLEILEADRNGKNPVRVKMTPGSHLIGDETRSILIEKI